MDPTRKAAILERVRRTSKGGESSPSSPGGSTGGGWKASGVKPKGGGTASERSAALHARLAGARAGAGGSGGGGSSSSVGGGGSVAAQSAVGSNASSWTPQKQQFVFGHPGALHRRTPAKTSEPLRKRCAKDTKEYHVNKKSGGNGGGNGDGGNGGGHGYSSPAAHGKLSSPTGRAPPRATPP